MIQIRNVPAEIHWAAKGEAVGRMLEGDDVAVPVHLNVEVPQVNRRLAFHSVITPARGRAMLELLS
jgi:hypothetical protein